MLNILNLQKTTVPPLPAGTDENGNQSTYSKNEQLTYSKDEQPAQVKKNRLAGQSYRLKGQNQHMSKSSAPLSVPKNHATISPAAITATDNMVVDNHAASDSLPVNTSSELAANNSSSSPTIAAVNSEQTHDPAKEYKKLTLADITSAVEDKKKTKSINNKNVTFGIFAGSFINYAGGSENKLSLGAGFTSEIKLTKNLNLLTGISLAQNDLSFKKNEVPRAAEASFMANTGNNITAMKVISYNLDQYEASLLGLDIPVDLKYTFSGQKNQFYLAAGVGSGTFINEAYTYHYSSSGPTGSKLYSSSQPESYNKIEKGASGFDFAKMLNFSLGVGYPVGKKSTLIIEPFMNYPLRTVGDEDIRFGSGGINLKFNFRSLK